MTKKRKPRRPTPDQIREAMRNLPLLKHYGDPPEELLADYKRTLRNVALSLDKKTRRMFRSRDCDEVEWAHRDLTHLVMDEMDDVIVKRYAPPVQLSVTTESPWRINIYWTAIKGTDIKGETVYSFRDRIKINNGDYLVGWKWHFQEAFFERFGGDREGYNRMRLTFASVLRDLDMEVVDDEQEPGVWLWRQATDGSLQHVMVHMLTEGTCAHVEDYAVRIGFCPIQFVGAFARLKTFLTPAMRVAGINASLCDMMNLWDANDRAWEEIIKLHDKLPLIKRIPKDWLRA